MAAAAGRFGASTVYVVDAPAFEAPLPQPRVDALEAVVAASGAQNVPLCRLRALRRHCGRSVGEAQCRRELGCDRLRARR